MLIFFGPIFLGAFVIAVANGEHQSFADWTLLVVVGALGALGGGLWLCVRRGRRLRAWLQRIRAEHGPDGRHHVDPDGSVQEAHSI